MKTWHIGGVDMTYPLLVAAGVCKTPHSIIPYQHEDLPIGAVVGGSYTYDMRTGNSPQPLSTWIQGLQSGLNAYGMPNIGLVDACHVFQKMKLTRPFVLSFAGFSPEEYVNFIAFCHSDAAPRKFAALELNLGCPNAHDRKTVPMSYDLPSLSGLLRRCAKLFEGIRVQDRIPIWVKMSPFLLKDDVEILAKRGIDTNFVPFVSEPFIDDVVWQLRAHEMYVRAVVNCNTIPNCRYPDTKGGWVTAPNEGKAGLSGSLLKTVALRQTKKMREIFPASIDVIGCGGILTGDDAMEFFQAGAQGVACTSLPYWHGGPKSLTSLIEGSEALQHFLYTHKMEDVL